MPKKTKILIVEDYHKIAKAWSTILTQESYNIVGICSSETETLDKAKILNPDIILMDINLEEGNGISCTKALSSIQPGCKVIALSLFNDEKYLKDMFNAGALGYVTKNSSVKEIIKAIETVIQGNSFICEEMRII